MPLTQTELQSLLQTRYTLERELGGGSMAQVYLARDGRHGRQVAIKVLSQEYPVSFAAERFLREIAIAARLQHPHIVPLLDSGEAGRHLFLVMPFVEGESLRQRLSREGRLPLSDVIRILGHLADALAYAHSKGIIHRDIKPDNILLAGRHALVTDFGVAKAVRVASADQPDLTLGTTLGTPAYMAPEQVAGDPEIDHRADLYALGVVGYEMLAGHPPFEGPTVQAVLTAQMLDDPAELSHQRVDLSPALDEIIKRALRKEPGERWQSAEAIARALEPLAVPSGSSSPASRTQPTHWTSLLAGLGAAALFVTAVIRWTGRQPSPAPAGGQRPVTFSGRVKASALAPDGRSVAFIAESAARHWLKVQDLSGGAALTVASGPHFDLPSWSDDGAEVRVFAIDSSKASIRRVPRLGGPGQVLSAGGWSALSPNGRFRVTMAPGPSSVRSPVVLIDLLTRDSLTVQADTGYWQSPPAWSPDGSRFAWSAERQTGSRTRILVASANRPVATVVYEDSTSIGTPAWDRDGALFFFRQSGGVADLFHLVIPLDGAATRPAQLIQAGLQAGSPRAYTAFFAPVSVSSDGARVLYTRRQTWSNLEFAPFEAWRRGDPPHRLSNGSADYHGVRMAPDGQSLALVETDIEGTSVQILPLNGGSPQTLGRIANYSGLSWSPDGSRLALVVTDPDSGVGLQILGLRQPAARSYFFGQVGDSPEWLDDSSLVVPGPGNRRMKLAVPGSGHIGYLPGIDPRGWMMWERAAPGGNQIALMWNLGRSGDGGVFVYTRSDSSLRRLAGPWLLPTRWSADGRSVYLVSYQFYDDTTRVAAYPVSGGPPQLLGVFPPGVRVEDVSPDGRGAVLIRRETRSDGWLIDLARARP